MQNLEKRITALEAVRGTELEAMTDDELEARIAALKKLIAEEETAAKPIHFMKDDHVKH